ncbi:glycosyltransferase family 8 protein [Flagelloscypha sp. PMI_526]|nr:glycosyltransferase family 8 protein [Flagelloscypha sp. PMI_526]
MTGIVETLHLPQDDWNSGALVHYTDMFVSSCLSLVSYSHSFDSNSFPTMQTNFRPTTPEERAVVTALFTEGYAHTVAALGHSLRRVGVKARMVMIYIPGQISDAALCIAQTQGWEAHAVSRIPPPHNSHLVQPEFRDQYTKLQLWSLDSLGIRSLIYLDADTLVLRPILEALFDLPFTFAAVPDGIDKPLINGGALFVKTDTRIRDDMVSKLETAEYNLAWAEQNFLNLYWGGHILMLPWLFNGNVWMKFQSPNLWRGMKDELVVIHFTSAKPLPARKSVSLTLEETEKAIQFMLESQLDWEEELRWWGNEWLSMRDDSLQKLIQCVPARNATGSNLRLKAAGVPEQYW